MYKLENQKILFAYNFLKLMILGALVFATEPMTSREIAEVIGVSAKNVSQELYAWQKYHYHYVRRLKPKKGSGTNAYRYKINKKGIRAYLQYVKRVHLGFDLNRRRHTPRRMSTYTGLKVIDMRKPENWHITAEEALPYCRIKVYESNTIC